MATRPQNSVTAKPLIGPVPNWNRKAAAISAVACVSRMVSQTRSKPLVMAAFAGPETVPDELVDEGWVDRIRAA